MNISIITVGKLKERYLKEAVEEYSTRFQNTASGNHNVRTKKLPRPEPCPGADSHAKEGQGILRHIKEVHM
jgi:23S rRNA (pseudouridine1915-N3)-methyltransferase